MPAGTDSPSSHRALVALAPAPLDAHPHRPIQRTAAFLAHLIATARQIPQARARRRAEPADVIAAYQATIAKLKALNEQPR
jgi:hypothetical protein